MLLPSEILLPFISLRQGIFDPANDPIVHQGVGANPDEQSHELLDEVYASPVHCQLLTHPALRSFVRDLVSWEKELLIKRALLRHICLGSVSTCIRYDRSFLRSGEAGFLTAGNPTGDCTATGSGLIYLENGCPLGNELEAEFARNAQGLSTKEFLDARN